METYTSVMDLSKASDSVVIGTVLDDGVKSVDHGFATPVEGAPDPSFPVLVYRFAVESTIASNSALPEVLSVVIPADAYGEDGISQLAKGQHLVMFLQHYVKTDVDGLTEAWAPMSYDNGEFEIKGDSVVARSMNLRSITAVSGDAATVTATSDELTTNVASLTKAVQSTGLATPREFQHPPTTGS